VSQSSPRHLNLSGHDIADQLSTEQDIDLDQEVWIAGNQGVRYHTNLSAGIPACPDILNRAHRVPLREALIEDCTPCLDCQPVLYEAFEQLDEITASDRDAFVRRLIA